MIRQYEGNGITTYTLRSGTELSLSEDDFQELLGFRDEMDMLRDELRVQEKLRINTVKILEYKCIDYENKIKLLTNRLEGRLI